MPLMNATKISRFRQLPNDSLLTQFLSRHHRHKDPLCRGFITRRDRSTVKIKKIAFIKAFATNIILFALAATLGIFNITWVIFTPGLPLYFKLPATIVQNLIIASAIIVVLRTTTIPFFLGECRLRLIYGFRPSEIIIRNLSSPSPTKTARNNGRRGEADATENQRMERYWRSAVQAINPALLYSNPGAMLSSNYWTMEYRALFDAQEMIASGALDEDVFEFAIYERDKEDGWTVCELWRMHEIMHDQQEIDLFKTFLSGSGKEELLAVWKEMLPDVASSHRRHERSLSTKAYQAVVDKFAREGLDYDTVWSVLPIS